MKKTIFAVCAVVMALLVLAGCVSSKADSAQENTKPNSDAAVEQPAQDTASASDTAADESEESKAEASDTTSDTPAAAARTISPLPTGIDMEHLDDCTVAVSFEQGDAYVDETGAMQLKVKVYVYDTYDVVDISMLQVGDQITICQKNVTVESLERDESGTVIINGGLENGGYELASSEESGFCAVGFDDLKQYYELGEATIPVSADFEFVDDSDPEKGSVTYYPGDLLTDGSGIEYNFVPNNTTITIQGGYVINMQRVYNP